MKTWLPITSALRCEINKIKIKVGLFCSENLAVNRILFAKNITHNMLRRKYHINQTQKIARKYRI